MGLEKHFAILDATTSEVKIDVPELLNARKMVPQEFKDLNLDATQGFKPEYLRYAKVNEPDEAKRIVEYKLKYIYPDKDILLGDPHLVNVPVWEFEINGKKISVFGTDENYKKNVSNWLQKNFPKKGKPQSLLFVETVEQLKKPHLLLKDFFNVVKSSNKLLLILILIIVAILVYFIINKIILKIK